MAQEIPVYLFTGFMDSGKTTLLQDTLFENEFGDGATMAKLGDGRIVFDYEMNQVPTLSAGSATDPGDSGWYAFMASFRIEFSESEVARNFSLDLKMAKSPDADYEDHTSATLNSFVLPSSQTSKSLPTFLYKIENNRGVSAKAPNALNLSTIDDAYNKEKWTDFKNKTGLNQFSPDTLYIGICKAGYSSTLDPDTGVTKYSNVNYDWYSKSLISNGSVAVNNENFIVNNELSNLYSYSNDTSNNTYNIDLGFNSKVIFFRMVFFSEFRQEHDNTTSSTTDRILVNESSKILFRLEIAQVGGKDDEG